MDRIHCYIHFPLNADSWESLCVPWVQIWNQSFPLLCRNWIGNIEIYVQQNHSLKSSFVDTYIQNANSVITLPSEWCMRPWPFESVQTHLNIVSQSYPPVPLNHWTGPSEASECSQESAQLLTSVPSVSIKQRLFNCSPCKHGKHAPRKLHGEPHFQTNTL